MVKKGVVTYNVTTPFLTYRLLVLFRGVLLYNKLYVKGLNREMTPLNGVIFFPLWFF